MINDQRLSQVVFIDIQEKLVDVMIKNEIKKVIDASTILIEAAKILEVPCLYTEQYPKGLGPTVKELKSLLPHPPIEKKAFSCLDAPNFKSHSEIKTTNYFVWIRNTYLYFTNSISFEIFR